MGGTLTPVSVTPFNRTFHGEKGVVFDDERPFTKPRLEMLVKGQHMDGLGIHAREPQSALGVVLRNQRFCRLPLEPGHCGAHVVRQAGTLGHHVMLHHLPYPR